MIIFDEKKGILSINGKEINFEGFYNRSFLDSTIHEVAEYLDIPLGEFSRYEIKAKMFQEHLQLIAKYLLQFQQANTVNLGKVKK